MYLHVVETQCLALTRYAGLSLLSSVHVLITVGVVKMLRVGGGISPQLPGGETMGKYSGHLWRCSCNWSLMVHYLTMVFLDLAISSHTCGGFIYYQHQLNHIKCRNSGNAHFCQAWPSFFFLKVWSYKLSLSL